MAKTDKLLKALCNNLKNWTCGYCNSDSNQPAATFREIKKKGYSFEEVSSNRWGKLMYCEVCKTNRSHYKLLSKNPEFKEKKRVSIDAKTRTKILQLFEGKDAFTGASITSTPEIDHKTPWSRLESDINASVMTDSEIKDHFQLLTREHNLLKDRACGECKNTNKRPAFLQIEYWYEGDTDYKGSCVGCGWHDGKKWRIELNKLLIQKQ